MLTTVKSCLANAALNGHRSIAFPTMGLGCEQYPTNIMCESIVKAVEEYSEQNPHSSLCTVKIYMSMGQTSVSQREVSNS